MAHRANRSEGIVKIAILVEGRMEVAFKPHLHAFLESVLATKMPRLDFRPYDVRIPTDDKLRRVVEQLLTLRPAPADAVVALTDVYTGTNDFADASDAKKKMRDWVGNDPRFFPHAARHDFEAWLIPYWDEIQRVAGHNHKAPAGNPEAVNHNKPPSRHIQEIFPLGTARNHYSKARDGSRILRSKDQRVSASRCSELKAFLNTIIGVSGGVPI